jgi:hypothetical protein
MRSSGRPHSAVAVFYRPRVGCPWRWLAARHFCLGKGSLHHLIDCRIDRTSQRELLFCVAWAKGGYLPTHNPNYRMLQGPDPEWNAANCRNRRIFDDRAVRKVAQNRKPFLLQAYRRNMGGGKFVLMKDLSSPIFVDGRLWGAGRMRYQ